MIVFSLTGDYNHYRELDPEIDARLLDQTQEKYHTKVLYKDKRSILQWYCSQRQKKYHTMVQYTKAKEVPYKGTVYKDIRSTIQRYCTKIKEVPYKGTVQR